MFTSSLNPLTYFVQMIYSFRRSEIPLFFKVNRYRKMHII
ncbi:hypothetical protein BACIH_0967 [Bacillus amyloliquefaciens]|nr:hypothetical protein U471_10000 [Bacillus amyloliquefaciens CC178]QEY88692.1 hypothetical protein BACIT_0733 [Bacillus amyloliquefaciens]QEY92733.1 hypothetical protein BACIH_0967 [Bacillus amyloliquefaciens]